ncbi:hypothetical protein MTBBW1_2740003 [Desulfamplus magnetovallimortis]|uniref:Uncharacterized protein n=1 Tax=Desulfamplus magnetovallimortis TaxID=1246637 RepID=A0A1W1HFI8_9BACT|nr:hypothetical protein [Desulfamplus magnetovallimortis]SLM31142.1 hypothetical protein MTBBW1_2740003 [Desulfamplus magnetovallimortis]
MYSKDVLVKAESQLMNAINAIENDQKDVVHLLCSLHRCKKVIDICMMYGFQKYRNILKRDFKVEIDCINDRILKLKTEYDEDSEFGKILSRVETKIVRFKMLIGIN